MAAAAKKAKAEAKKLEKLKAEAEAWRQTKRDELQREITAQKRNKVLIDKKWRELMLRIKEPVFRKDIEVMWHVFERIYDKKDHLIQYTLKLVNVAEDQFQRTVSSFCETIDNMTNKFLADLDDMSKENDMRTATMLKRGEDEARQIMKDHNIAETHLQLLLYHAHTTADALAWTRRGENLVKEDEERNKAMDERENLRSLLENTFSNMWDSYKFVLKSYILNTVDNQKHIRRLKAKERIMCDIIEAQGKKIANNDGLLKRLRLELQAYESGTKQAIFRARRDRHRKACNDLKEGMYKGNDYDMFLLGLLVDATDKALARIKQAHIKAEKISRIYALCRRHETRREKVLPFGTQNPQKGIDVANLRKLNPNDTLVPDAIAKTNGLVRLWHRVAYANTTKCALIREKELLEEENKCIMYYLQENKNSVSTKPENCLHSTALGNDDVQVLYDQKTQKFI